jgi:rhodanese-related sulfurtransferase/DNA-directed RNA polymerase subunit RPC12/RpoP
MKTAFLRLFILGLIVVFFIKGESIKDLIRSKFQKTESYQCLPCGQDCDNNKYAAEGKCAVCGMQFVKTSSIVFKTIQPSEICGYILKHPSVILLDVRTNEEFEGKVHPDFGTLKNAVNIPIQELAGRLPGISSLKNKEIIVYCSHSHRSPEASYLLTQNGFTNVTNMAGGMSLMKTGACKK